MLEITYVIFKRNVCQIGESGAVQTCSTHEGDEIFIPNFSSKPEGRESFENGYRRNYAEWI